MNVYVGTSGWRYPWNEGRSLDWYVEHSGLNAVELNASFYRFPFSSYVKSWSKKGKGLRWAVKVHRSITHLSRFGDKAYDAWKRLWELFERMDDLVDFYLFQLPPSFTPDGRDRIEKFVDFTRLGRRFALEWRNKEWFTEDNIEWASKLGITVVSVSAPKLPEGLINTSGAVYLRMHGRENWYDYEYTEDELVHFIEEIKRIKPEEVYVFFNNDEYMLKNARFVKEQLGGT